MRSKNGRTLSASATLFYGIFRERGIVGGIRFLLYRLEDYWYERRLGICSYDYRTPQMLGFTSGELYAYSPISYRACVQLLVHSAPQDGVFLDIGCGQGRAVVMAAIRPYARVIGVELSDELCQIAQQNINKAKGNRKLKCDQIEIVCQNACDYVVPGDVSVIFFNNPFSGSVLRAVIQQIRTSLEKTPRKITILFGNPRNFQPMISEFPWIKLVAKWNCYPETGLAVYHGELVSPHSDRGGYV